MEPIGFKYIKGHLHCDGISVSGIAEKYGTPCYVYSKATLVRRLTDFREAFSEYNPLICFSVKSLSNLSVLKTISDAGAGFDIVSGGELFRVIKSSGDPAKTVFAGVGKTREEIRFALKQEIHMFNVESESEMRLINHEADDIGCKAGVAIRVNPDVDPHTHEKTTTGKKENKFGISIEAALKLAVETKKNVFGKPSGTASAPGFSDL